MGQHNPPKYTEGWRRFLPPDRLISRRAEPGRDGCGQLVMKGSAVRIRASASLKSGLFLPLRPVSSMSVGELLVSTRRRMTSRLAGAADQRVCESRLRIEESR
jgi:hypothetical protein